MSLFGHIGHLEGASRPKAHGSATCESARWNKTKGWPCKTFTDKASGEDVERPQLEAMQSFGREGDTVFCHSMDRLARNLDDLRRIVLGLTERGVHIVFVKEPDLHRRGFADVESVAECDGGVCSVR